MPAVFLEFFQEKSSFSFSSRKLTISCSLPCVFPVENNFLQFPSSCFPVENSSCKPRFHWEEHSQERVCYWENTRQTAGKSFLLEKLKENCRQELSTVKMQGKLHERVFYCLSTREHTANVEIWYRMNSASFDMFCSWFRDCLYLKIFFTHMYIGRTISWCHSHCGHVATTHLTGNVPFNTCAILPSALEFSLSFSSSKLLPAVFLGFFQ